MLIGPRVSKTLNIIERIQPRMMAAMFKGNPRATIISCYSPTNVSEETELVAFYDELSSLVCSIPKHNILVIGGDMNAQIGKNGNNRYSLHNTSNRNGQHLTEFMMENRLTCLNTNYQKREGKLWTYTYANFRSPNNHGKDTKKTPHCSTTKHYDWALLNNRNIRDKYVLELRNRFETLQEKTDIGTPNDEYENFVNVRQRSVFQQNLELNIESHGKCAHVKTASKSYRKNPTNANAIKLKTNRHIS